MRHAREGRWLIDGKGRLFGVNLGADHVSEHEWGIMRMKRAFGIPDDGLPLGMAARTVTACPGMVKTWRGKEIVPLRIEALTPGRSKLQKELTSALVYSQADFSPERSELHARSDAAFAAAWDETSFALAVGDADEDKLRTLLDAFQRLDAAVWVGGGGAFQNGGLTLAIPSLVPYELKEKMLRSDKERRALRDASDATGIEEYLKRCGRQWYALSPQWVTPERSSSTQHKVIYWLNPMEQDRHNFGWFTVEQLTEWGEGRGPCMKTEAQRKGR